METTQGLYLKLINTAKTELKNEGKICNACGIPFSRSNAKFPVYKNNKKTKYYICSECKFRNKLILNYER